jgi:predicted nucleotidyltransferase
VAPALNPLERALQRIVSELSRVGRSVALVGGLAVSARAEPRTTRDVDLAVSVAGDEDAEQLVFHLQNRDYVVRMLLEREDSGRIATIRLTRDTERAVYVDLLFASSGIETEIVNDAEPTEIVEGISVPVATRAHLIALKVLARDDRNRPQDWDDLRALLLDASSQEILRAREALELIERRGYNRGRSLSADLDRALVEMK